MVSLSAPVSRGAVHFLRQIPGFPESLLNSGQCTAQVLSTSSEEFQLILDYVTHGQVHSYGVQLLQVLQISRKAEQGYPTTGQNSRMLWHGTHNGNVPLILENGLQLPEYKRQMFGAGIYFADRISKSARYTSAAGVAGREGYLFLCEVDLGKVLQTKSYCYEMDLWIRFTPHNSVRCAGRRGPDQNEQIEKGLRN